MQRDLFLSGHCLSPRIYHYIYELLFSNINYSKFSFERLIAFDFDHKLIRIVFFVVLIFISIIKLWKLFKFDGKESIKIPRKMEISPESDSLMNYIVTYFTPLLSFDMNNKTSILMNLLLFLLIGLMYVGSHASYLNPVLGVFGFKIFGVTGFPHAHHIITNLSFDDIETVRRNRCRIN